MNASVAKVKYNANALAALHSLTPAEQCVVMDALQAIADQQSLKYRPLDRRQNTEKIFQACERKGYRGPFYLKIMSICREDGEGGVRVVFTIDDQQPPNVLVIALGKRSTFYY